MLNLVNCLYYLCYDVKVFSIFEESTIEERENVIWLPLTDEPD